MYDYMKSLQRQFDTKTEYIQDLKVKISQTHKELSARLSKEDRRLLLKLVDLEDALREETTVHSFVSGYRLACGIHYELSAEPKFSTIIMKFSTSSISTRAFQYMLRGIYYGLCTPIVVFKINARNIFPLTQFYEIIRCRPLEIINRLIRITDRKHVYFRHIKQRQDEFVKWFSQILIFIDNYPRIPCLLNHSIYSSLHCRWLQY